MTLTIQDLGALGEFFGSIAVLATLIYLALQTRQNTMAIASQVDSARISASSHIGLTVAASAEIMEALAEDRAGDVTLNEERRISVWRVMFYNFQWQFVQGRRGLLPTYQEAGVAAGVRSFFSIYRSFDSWWEDHQTAYVPEFVAWVEEQRSKAA